MASFYNAAIGEKMRGLNGVFLNARGMTSGPDSECGIDCTFLRYAFSDNT